MTEIPKLGQTGDKKVPGFIGLFSCETLVSKLTYCNAFLHIPDLEVKGQNDKLPTFYEEEKIYR